MNENKLKIQQGKCFFLIFMGNSNELFSMYKI